MKQFFVGLCMLAWMAVGPAWAEPTTVTWHGHAAFQIVTPKGTVLMIDPWLKNPVNPAAKAGDPYAGIDRVDYILLTHGHFDHVGDAVELANRTGARLVSNFELGSNLAKLQGYPKDQMGFDTLFNIGGEIQIADGEITVAMTPAVHSSGMNNPFADDTEADIVYGGNPGGFVVQIADGPTIYHTGDTAYFTDMKLIGKRFDITLALINIGGHFGMEPMAAAQAVKAVRPKLALPHHFGTFPVLSENPAAFAKAVKGKAKVLSLAPGGTLTFDGDKLMP
jgi:L-ascorbate metabolism protein UlaG (beta-lactamase superfamily)